LKLLLIDHMQFSIGYMWVPLQLFQANSFKVNFQ
jgi:hypothetical protein